MHSMYSSTVCRVGTVCTAGTVCTVRIVGIGMQYVQ